MQEFLLAAGVIIPLFLIIALGYFLRCRNVISEKFAQKGNQLCFKLFIPVLLFYNIYSTDIQALFNLRLIVFTGVALAIIFIVLWFLTVRFEKDNKKRGVMIQGMMRSNFVVLGMPIVINLFGKESAGMVGLLLSVVLPMYNVLSVFALEYFASKQKEQELLEQDEQLSPLNQRRWKLWRDIIIQVVTNPLIIACILGYFFALTGIRLPNLIIKSVTQVADVATGFSLLILGASFQIRSIRRTWKQLVCAVSTRLLIIPTAGLTAAALLGFRGVELATLISVFASPTSVSSFSMAQNIGGDDDLAANIIVFTSFFSMFTLFLFVYVFELLKFF